MLIPLSEPDKSNKALSGVPDPQSLFPGGVLIENFNEHYTFSSDEIVNKDA